MSYYFQNARLLTGKNAVALENACVVVENDRITYAGEMSAAPDVPAGAQVIDLCGRIIAPAFVNAHTHSAMVLFRGMADDLPLHRWLNERIWPMEERLDEEAIYWGSMLAIAEMVRGGTAAFNDMYFHVEQTVRAVEQTGIRAVLPLTMTCQSEDAEAIDQKIAAAVDFHARYHRTARGRVRVLLAPHAEYTCTRPFFERCAKAAKRLDTQIHIHVSETKEEHEACKQRHGLTPIGLLNATGMLDTPTLAAHCVHVETEDIRIMADKGVTVLHNPQSNLKLGSGIAPIQKMLEAGVKVALGTDGAASNNNLSMMEEMQLSSLLQKGLTGDAQAVDALTALRMATVEGGAALHTHGGEIKAGNKADLQVLSIHRAHLLPLMNVLNNVVYSANDSDVWMTMVDGQVLYHDGKFPTMDIERVLTKAAQTAARVAQF